MSLRRRTSQERSSRFIPFESWIAADGAQLYEKCSVDWVCAERELTSCMWLPNFPSAVFQPCKTGAEAALSDKRNFAFFAIFSSTWWLLCYLLCSQCLSCRHSLLFRTGKVQGCSSLPGDGCCSDCIELSPPQAAVVTHDIVPVCCIALHSLALQFSCRVKLVADAADVCCSEAPCGVCQQCCIDFRW